MAIQLNRRLRLPESEYFAEAQRKTGIAIHHTVCREAKTAFESWRTDGDPAGGVRHVATAYLIDEDGTVFEVFDPEAWAWQFGLAWPEPVRTTFEKRFIGIEIANEGPLTEHEGNLYTFGHTSSQHLRPKTQAFEYGQSYRGYRWFTPYQPVQLASLAGLVDELCGRFSIPRVYPDSPFDYHGEALEHFSGVIGHAMVRRDKSDPAPDRRLWQILENRAGLSRTAIASFRASPLTRLTGPAIEILFRENMVLVNSMDVAAGSLVKDLLMELERRRVYLRLHQPAAGGHGIRYDVSQGHPGDVATVAMALGFKTVTDSLLEVHDAA